MHPDGDRAERTDDIVRDAARELLQLVRPFAIDPAEVLGQPLVMAHQQRRDAAAENGHHRPGDVEAVGKLQGTQTDLFEARRGGDRTALLGGKLVRQ